MKICRMTPFYYLPRMFYICAGYTGLDNGLAIGWLGKMVTIIKPVNERINFINY